MNILQKLLSFFCRRKLTNTAGLGDKYQRLHYVTGKPKSVNLKIGNIVVTCPDVSPLGTKIFINGEEFRGIRSIKLEASVEEAWTVVMEYYPFMREDNECRSADGRSPASVDKCDQHAGKPDPLS